MVYVELLAMRPGNGQIMPLPPFMLVHRYGAETRINKIAVTTCTSVRRYLATLRRPGHTQLRV
jgi:hypothetical protein